MEKKGEKVAWTWAHKKFLLSFFFVKKFVEVYLFIYLAFFLCFICVPSVKK